MIPTFRVCHLCFSELKRPATRSIAVLPDDLGDRDVDVRTAIQFPHSGMLLPGQSYTRTETITLVDDLEGDCWVAVAADPLNAVFENQLEHNNPIFAPKRTAVYREDRAVTGKASITVDQADRAEFPGGATIVLSGNAEATPGAVNAIFIIDLSGSTLTVTNLDANFDGVVDSRDNINRQDNFADILDVELGSILRVTSQLAGQVDDGCCRSAGGRPQGTPAATTSDSLRITLKPSKPR